MANFSAVIPVSFVEEANAVLEAQGFGPGNFSVPVRDGSGGATHAGLHCWNDPAFKAAVEAIGSAVLAESNSDGAVNFGILCASEALEWSDPAAWFENPVMTGDQRAFGGKTWVSLTDYNVWEPPVGWREVVAEGYPEWVQPTGAHDAYNIGDRVTFEGSDYESLIAANIWSPTAYPAGWLAL